MHCRTLHNYFVIVFVPANPARSFCHSYAFYTDFESRPFRVIIKLHSYKIGIFSVDDSEQEKLFNVGHVYYIIDGQRAYHPKLMLLKHSIIAIDIRIVLNPPCRFHKAIYYDPPYLNNNIVRYGLNVQ